MNHLGTGSSAARSFITYLYIFSDFEWEEYAIIYPTLSFYYEYQYRIGSDGWFLKEDNFIPSRHSY